MLQAGPIHQFAQDLAALQQGQGPKVMTCVKKQVENVVHDVCRAGIVKRVLQSAKVWNTTSTLHHNFAIQPAGAETCFGQRRHQCRQFGRPVMAIAREAANRPPLHACEQPVAIKLDFVHPALVICRYLLDQCCKLG